jgi:hypothetical protein
MDADIGQTTEPSSCKMTRGEPLRAHANAHSPLIGLSKPLVKAHAESKTQPVIVFSSPAEAAESSLAAASELINK